MSKRNVYRSPEPFEQSFMDCVHAAIELATGVQSEEYSSDCREHKYVRCRVIFGYHCREHGIPNVVASRSIGRCHSAITGYIEHYNMDYKSNYRGFKTVADKVSAVLLKNKLK